MKQFEVVINIAEALEKIAAEAKVDIPEISQDTYNKIISLADSFIEDNTKNIKEDE